MYALLQQPYRLFFLGAAAYAVIAMAMWLLHVSGVMPLAMPSPNYWHGYEMIFGYAAAAITGFLLSAAHSWTGYRVVSPGVLLLLFMAWLLGRFASVFAWSPIFILLGDGVFLLGLAVALGRVMWLSRQRVNLRFLPIVGLFALIAISIQLAMLGWLPQWQSPLLRIAIELLLVLMVILGGRAIPFFTQRRFPGLSVEDPDWLGFYTGFFLVLALVFSWVFPGNVAAMFSWFAGCFVMARLFYWSPYQTWPEPLLWILHLGYFWLGLALFLRGGSLAWSWLPLEATYHVITVGGLGSFVLGMMARVILGYGRNDLGAPWWLLPAFLFMVVAAVPLLLSDGLGWPSPVLAQSIASILWLLASLIFLLGFAPALIRGQGSRGAG